MILFKKLTPEDALFAIAAAIGQHLPDRLKDSELTLSFLDDHSVEVYLEETKQTEPVLLS